jgi:hypothetical protein
MLARLCSAVSPCAARGTVSRQSPIQTTSAQSCRFQSELAQTLHHR